jgi:tetratricopeptide (TPR) repeat protein
MMLATLLKLAGDDTTVILVSDHGFHPDHLRPAHIPFEPAGPAVEHSPYGILVMKGPGIKRDERIHGASLLDITPTILTLFGLPVGADMHGKPLVQAFEEPPTVETIPSWEEVPGDDGRHPHDVHIDPIEAQEAVHQLVALGYIEDPGAERAAAVAKTVREMHYNLAQSYLDAHRYSEALPLLEQLWDEAPDELRFAHRLADCCRTLGRLADCRRTITALLATQERLAREARQKLLDYQGQHTLDTALSEPDRHEIRRLRALAAPSTHTTDYLLGTLLVAEDKPAEALVHLRRAEAAELRLPALHLLLGQVYLKVKRWEDAERAFCKALDIDPHDAQAHFGLALSLLPRRRNVEAAEAVLAAVGLLYYFPQAHFQLGVALHRLGEIPRAIEAFQVALAQYPHFAEAHRRLALIYAQRLNDPVKAAQHRARADAIRRQQRQRPLLPLPPGEGRGEGPQRLVQALHPLPGGRAKTPAADTVAEEGTGGLSHNQRDDARGNSVPTEVITVVSGLPRSGTSLMMQMLHTGGHPCLSDELRPADADNPRGYFEYEKVKQLRRDHVWLPDAQGKAVKIVAPLLPFLPLHLPYRVIFMERDLDEVIASQGHMLVRQGRRGSRLSPERLQATFVKQLRQVKVWLARHDIPTLYVVYHDVLTRPVEVADRLNVFLGGSLDAHAMGCAVDPALYRQRRAQAGAQGL